MPKHVNLGWALLGWLVCATVVALNRGIDLLWAMVLLLASALLVAWLLPHLQLRRVSVRRVLPDEAIAGEPVTLKYEIEVRGWLPCFGVELHDRGGDGRALVPMAYFRALHGTSTQRLRWTPPVRGVRRFDALVLESRYPLGLSRAQRRIDAGSGAITVYPGRVDLRALPDEACADPQSENLVSDRRGGRDEFFGLKPYRPGDDWRAIHWRATARAGEPLVREFEHPQDPRLWLVLELSADVHLGAGAAGSAEFMFRIAHSIAARARVDGMPIGLLWAERGELRRIEPAVTQANYLRLRETLALVELEPGAPLGFWLHAQQSRLPRGGSWLMFNLGGERARMSLLQSARNAGARPLLLEFEATSFAADASTTAMPLRSRPFGDAWIHTVPRGADLSTLFR